MARRVSPFRIPRRQSTHDRSARFTCGTFVHRGVPTFVRRSCPLSVSCMVHGRSRISAWRGPRPKTAISSRSCRAWTISAWCPRRRFRHAPVVHHRTISGVVPKTGRRRRAPSSFTMPGDDGRLEPRSNERANAARAHSNPTGLEHFISESGPFLAEPARSSL